MPQEILVDGLPPSFTEEELKLLFSTCGLVLSVEIEMTLEGLQLGIARVQMGSIEEAEQAVRHMDHATLRGRTLLVFRTFRDGGPMSQAAGGGTMTSRVSGL
jgi:RNA recognition motif-containing protein